MDSFPYDSRSARARCRLTLTERDLQVAQYVFRFGCLARDQVRTLCGFGSITRVNCKCADLVRAGILRRKQLPYYPGHGDAQTIYCPGRASAALLEADADAVTSLARQVARWHARQIEHVRAANQVLVDFVSALATRSGASLTRFCTELELRRMFVNRGLVPDGWISWQDGGKRFNACIEVDLHHERLTLWRDKICAYLRYLDSGEHASLFGFRSCRVLVLARTEARLRNIRALAGAAGRLFLFAELTVLNPTTVFAPIWQLADGSARIALPEA